MNKVRSEKDISKLDFENSKNKKVVSIEHFCYEAIYEINGMKYFNEDIIVGAIDYVSHRYQIKCKESYKEVFDFVYETLRDLGY